MSQLIDREKLIEKCTFGRDCYGKRILICSPEAVLDAPVLETDGLRHGQWHRHPNPDFSDWDYCSICGIGCKRRTEEGEYMYLYCPNCGAKMEGLY